MAPKVQRFEYMLKALFKRESSENFKKISEFCGKHRKGTISARKRFSQTEITRKNDSKKSYIRTSDGGKLYALEKVCPNCKHERKQRGNLWRKKNIHNKNDKEPAIPYSFEDAVKLCKTQSNPLVFLYTLQSLGSKFVRVS